MAEFKGLTSEHFSTYEPSRWSSMVHNLARMQAKDAMVALAQSATDELGDAELLDLASANAIPGAHGWNAFYADYADDMEGQR